MHVTWKLKYKENDGENFVELLDASTVAMDDYLLQYRQKRHALKFNMSLHAVIEKAIDSDPPIVLAMEPI